MNKEKIIAEICETLSLNNKNYCMDEVVSLVDRWADAKDGLINILRKHPNWNEDSMAIIFDSDIVRDVNKDVVCDALKSMKRSLLLNVPSRFRTESDLIAEHGVKWYENLTDGEAVKHNNLFGKEVVVTSFYGNNATLRDYHFYWNIDLLENRDELRIIANTQEAKNIEYLRTLLEYTCDFDSILTERVASVLRTFGINAVEGQKTSRAFNALFKAMGLTEDCMGYKESNGKMVSIFNSTYARMADALNPLTIKRHTVLSVNPIDYLLMSNGNSWRSCHNLVDGCYQVGTLSYMCDGVSMIFYTVDKSYEGNQIYFEPKINRCVFCFEGNTLLQSRVYPDNSESIRKQIRAIVQEVMAKALNIPNYWSTKTNNVDELFNTVYNSQHYPDYNYNGCRNVSVIMGEEPNEITIGSEAYCLMCGEELEQSGSLNCEKCTVVYCEECGRELIPRHDIIHEIDDHIYCDDCVNFCEVCRRYYVGDEYEVYDTNGNSIYVCYSCYCDDCVNFCEECGRYYIGDEYEVYDTNGDRIYVCYSCFSSNYNMCDECYEYHATLIDGLCPECYKSRCDDEEEEAV